MTQGKQPERAALLERIANPHGKELADSSRVLRLAVAAGVYQMRPTIRDSRERDGGAAGCEGRESAIKRRSDWKKCSMRVTFGTKPSDEAVVGWLPRLQRAPAQFMGWSAQIQNVRRTISEPRRISDGRLDLEGGTANSAGGPWNPNLSSSAWWLDVARRDAAATCQPGRDPPRRGKRF